MKRREFIAGLGSTVAWPLAARAQQPEPIKRLGLLRVSTYFELPPSTEDLLKGLEQRGWIEGRNLRVDYRLVGSNDGEVARPHAESLIRAGPDVIFAGAATIARVLKELTHTIPIVFVQNGDPVQMGIVQSLARPGGNLTGFVNFETSINTKYLQLLKDIAPQVSRVGILQSRATTFRRDFETIETVAPAFRVATVALIVLDDRAGIEQTVVAFAREPNGGLVLPSDGVTSRHHELIVELAAKHRIPAVYGDRTFVDGGGLVSYAALPTDYQLVAGYVDRILRGAKPGDLPVQVPTKFELVINRKAANALGLTIPPNLLAIADKVIE
jgi:putative tryptophan/tyrosine transport system substrate-binding protein